MSKSHSSNSVEDLLTVPAEYKNKHKAIYQQGSFGHSLGEPIRNQFEYRSSNDLLNKKNWTNGDVSDDGREGEIMLEVPDSANGLPPRPPLCARHGVSQPVRDHRRGSAGFRRCSLVKS